MPLNSVYIDTCRVCMKVQCENRVTFEVDSEWSRLFNFCTGLSVSVSGENAPRVFCGECATLIKQYADFKNLCLKHDALWKNFGCNQKSIPSNDNKVKYEEDCLSNNYDDCDSNSDFESAQESAITTYYETEVMEIKEEIIDPEELKKNLIEIKPNNKVKSNEQFVEHTALSKKDLIRKYYDVKKENNRTSCFCKKCGDKLSHAKALLNHVRKCYSLKKLELIKEQEVEGTPQLPKCPLFYCGICDFKSKDKNVVTEHFNGHCANNILNCGLCEYVGTDIAHMVRHRFKHNPPEYRHKMSCPACPKVYQTLSGLEFHYRFIHLNKPGGLCSICDRVFKDRKAFVYHMIAHDEGNIYICDICKQTYTSRKSILEHLRIHKHNSTLVCQYCGRIFNKRHNLNIHIECVHSESMSLQCKHCNRIYKNHYTLQDHLKRVNQEKKYICDYCSKGFPSLKTLQKHLIWHSDDRPFACSICGKAYKIKSQLTQHKMTHTGKQYKCQVCSREFVAQRSFKRHQSVHTGVRGVKCLNCDQTFHNRKQMIAHCNRKHPTI